MRIPLKYAGKTIYVSPYNTKVEKDILVFIELVESPDLRDVLYILKDNISGDIEDLSNPEILAILWKLRSFSIGEEIGVKWKCSKCKSAQDGVINISEIIEPGTPNPLYIDKFKEMTEDNLQEFVNKDISEMDLDEMDELLEGVRASMTKFNLLKSATCLTCGTKQLFDISSNEYVLSCMSEDSIQSIYQSISDLVFFGNFTKMDVHDMTAFERSIFVGNLNKTREDLNK